MGEPIRVMVVDDSAIYRRIITEALQGLPGVDVVGQASNGEIALGRLVHLKPDAVTLDIEMPHLDGLETLRRLKREQPGCEAIMVSGQSERGAARTMEALAAGALDFVAKPCGGAPADNLALLRRQLAPIVDAIFTRRVGRIVEEVRLGIQRADSVAKVRGATAGSPPARWHRGPNGDVGIIGIGLSTGGPSALGRVLSQLPGDLNVPVVIAQHMPPVFTAQLADSLNMKCALGVTEGQCGQAVERNMVYVAPGGRHMGVGGGKGAGGAVLEISDDPPENYCRPAADFLFRSLARTYGPRAVAVVMTGMGRDGVSGLAEIKRQRGRTVAQDEASCTVFGMPGEAIKAGVIDAVVPLEEMAARLVSYVRAEACR